MRIHFCLYHLNLKRKRNIFPYRLAHVRESFIIHEVFYSLFILVWRHSNSLIQTIIAFIDVIHHRQRTYIECLILCMFSIRPVSMGL